MSAPKQAPQLTPAFMKSFKPAAGFSIDTLLDRGYAKCTKDQQEHIVEALWGLNKGVYNVNVSGDRSTKNLLAWDKDLDRDYDKFKAKRKQESKH